MIRANLSLGILEYEQLEISDALKYYATAQKFAERAELETETHTSYVYKINQNSLKAEMIRGASMEEWRKFNRIPIFGNLGVALAMTGKYDEALDALAQAIRLSEETGNTRFEAVWRYQKGMAHYALGEYDVAVKYFNKSLDLAKSLSAYRAQGFALAGLGKVSLAVHFLDSKNSQFNIQHLIDAVEIALKINNPRDMQDWGTTLAEGYLFANDLNEARRIIDATQNLHVAENKCRALLVNGIISICDSDNFSQGESLIRQTVSIADQLLEKTPDFINIRFIRGLAWLGIATISRDSRRSEYAKISEDILFNARTTCKASGVINDTRRLLETFKSMLSCSEFEAIHSVLL